MKRKSEKGKSEKKLPKLGLQAGFKGKHGRYYVRLNGQRTYLGHEDGTGETPSEVTQSYLETVQLVFEDGLDGSIVGHDPGFVNFAPGGNWQNWDLRLATGSPAIDAGRNELAVDAAGNPLQHDLDNNGRIANGRVDMGAYEYGSTPTQPPAIPGNFRNTDKTYNSVALVWNTAVRATCYDIRYA